MKNIAIHAYRAKDDVCDYVVGIIPQIKKHINNLYIEESFYKSIKNRGIDFSIDVIPFRQKSDLKEVDLMFSFGGDGTLLSAVTFIEELEIPIIGINMGRLGFLAHFTKEVFEKEFEEIIGSELRISPRTLISVHSETEDIPFNYALNEVAINRKETTSMISVEALLNQEYLNNYWADGLIVSTPTGSTGYSLSCGGPIIYPSSENFVITPIATHNLNVRPFIINDEDQIQITVNSRESHFLLSLDSRTVALPINTKLMLQKSAFKVNLVQPKNQSYLDTLRKKLYWGKDKRN